VINSNDITAIIINSNEKYGTAVIMAKGSNIQLKNEISLVLREPLIIYKLEDKTKIMPIIIPNK
jgi:hypothetical protein